MFLVGLTGRHRQRQVHRRRGVRGTRLAGRRRRRGRTRDRRAGRAGAAPSSPHRFGAHVLRADGSLDRPALAGWPSPTTTLARRPRPADPPAHRGPHRRAAGRPRAAEHRGDGPLIAVVDHPLLIETGQVGRFDEVVVVLAPRRSASRRLTDAPRSRRGRRAGADARPDRRRPPARGGDPRASTTRGTLAELEARRRRGRRPDRARGTRSGPVVTEATSDANGDRRRARARAAGARPGRRTSPRSRTWPGCSWRSGRSSSCSRRSSS